MSTAEKRELSLYEPGRMVGIDPKNKQRFKIVKELAKKGYLQFIANNGGFEYYEKIKE